MASSVASASSNTIFESLPARPPTPPREASHEREASLTAQAVRPASFDPRLSLQTPPNAGSAALANGTRSHDGSSRARKKVEWSSRTEYKEASEFPQGNGPNKPSPPSAPASALKPVKGILKPSSSPITLTTTLGSETNGSSTQSNMIEMLESTIKQLAGSDRHSRLDAYMVLARALKASNNLPDRVALQNRMSLFMQFIQRDVVAKTENATLDTSLINHALSLLATFLQFTAVASTITSDFGIFIVDLAIKFFEDPTAPKDVVRHLMQVVALQNFSVKVMTSERVSRLVDALHNIEAHLKGKSIIMSRIVIYKKLIRQSRSQMVTQCDWLEDLFTDMLSSVKEIRNYAVEFGADAGFSLRSEKHIIMRASELLHAKHEGETYIEFYIRKLQDMVKDKQVSAAVPQIWGVIILFMRCPLDRWTFYGPWLTLVQSAFNMADFTTKHEANYAWNRYVYLSLSDSKVSPKTLGTLCQPLLSQLRRKTGPKQMEEALRLRRVVLGGISNMWYYGLAPGNDKYPTSMVWDVTVQPVVNTLISLHGKPEIPGDCLMQASAFLASLFDVSTPRVWRQDRILDLPPARNEELPPIDAKWIRRNCDGVLQLVAAILENKFTDLANNDSLTTRLWTALVGSIASASAKDIKMSDETAKFLAGAFGILSKIWAAGPASSDKQSVSKFFSSVTNFVGIIANRLGVVPFTEKKFTLIDAHKYEPTNVPMIRTEGDANPAGVVRLPLHHLFVMLVTVPPSVQDDELLSDFFQSTFEPFFKDRPLRTRIDLSKELIHLLPKSSLTCYGPWVLAAHNMCRFLEQKSDKPGSTLNAFTQTLGPEYRDIVSTLERGLLSHPNLPMEQWQILYQAAANHAKLQVGDAGQALAVVEPIAKIVLDNLPEESATSTPLSLKSVITTATSLLEVARLPRDSQALEAARRRLWGNPITSVRSGFVDPFDNLYKLTNALATTLYDKLPALVEADSSDRFIRSIATFLERSFPLARLSTLEQFRSSLCMLIEDEQDRLYKDDVILSKTVCELWDQVCAELRNIGRCRREDFDLVEPLFAAAFKCKQHYISNKAAETWNALVQDEEEVDCSESLKSIVSSMRSKFDLAFPGSSRGSGAQALSFGDEDEPSLVALSSTSSGQSSRRRSTRQSLSAAVGTRSSSRKRKLDTAPDSERSTRQSKRASLSRKLRHEDSQIEFAPIEATLADEAESQHLTERQKEVRERQRKSLGLYSDIEVQSQSQSPRTRSGKATAITTENPEDAHQSTPQRATSFNDIISSTPTPRRGHVVQLDDLNDPPSSPPNPRPDPLQSERQSRSRGSSSLNWEFSSPPVSPVANQQQLPELKLTKKQPAQDAEGHGRRRGRKRVTRSSSQLAIPMDVDSEVIPSSIEVPQNHEDASASAVHPNLEPKQIIEPSTPVKRSSKLADNQEKPALRETSNPPMLRRTRSNISVKDGDSIQKDETELPKTKRSGKSKQQRAMTKRQQELAEEGFSSPAPPDTPASERGSLLHEPSSPIIPSTPAETPDGASGRQPRRKRKRGEGRGSGRNRKRRSMLLAKSSQESNSNMENTDTEKQAPALQPPREGEMHDVSTSPERRETPTTARVPGAEEMRTRSGRKVGIDVLRGSQREENDTDEELLSQLVTESHAASQNEEELLGTDALKAAKKEHVEGDEAVSKAADKPAIFGTLQEGLAQLRRATLTRDDVYKMEDMLMDMKRELFEAERRGRGA